MDLTLKVIEIKNGIIKVSIHNWVLDIPIDYLRQFMDRSLHDPIGTIIRNIGLRLSLARTDINTKADLIAALDNVIFKMVD